MMTGREMKRTPYIAQFSEYDLSSHPQLTKYADKSEESHSKTDRATRKFLLLLTPPTIRIVSMRVMNETMTGISMSLSDLPAAD